MRSAEIAIPVLVSISKPPPGSGRNASSGGEANIHASAAMALVNECGGFLVADPRQMRGAIFHHGGLDAKLRGREAISRPTTPPQRPHRLVRGEIGLERERFVERAQIVMPFCPAGKSAARG